MFPRHPRQKRPWSYHSAFCEGSVRHLYFYVFPRRPYQKRPWSHHYAFCVGSFRAPYDPGIQLRTGNLMDPFRGSAQGPVLGPGAFFPIISSCLPTRHIVRDKLTRWKVAHVLVELIHVLTLVCGQQVIIVHLASCFTSKKTMQR